MGDKRIAKATLYKKCDRRIYIGEYQKRQERRYGIGKATGEKSIAKATGEEI
jgi:hypothetical protein